MSLSTNRHQLLRMTNDWSIHEVLYTNCFWESVLFKHLTVSALVSFCYSTCQVRESKTQLEVRGHARIKERIDGDSSKTNREDIKK